MLQCVIATSERCCKVLPAGVFYYNLSQVLVNTWQGLVNTWPFSAANVHFCDIAKQYENQAAAAGLNHVAYIGNGEAGGATLPQCARIHSGCAAQPAAGRPGRALRRQQLPEVRHAAVLQAHHGQDAGQSEGACTPLLQCSACNICTTLLHI